MTGHLLVRVRMDCQLELKVLVAVSSALIVLFYSVPVVVKLRRFERVAR